MMLCQRTSLWQCDWDDKEAGPSVVGWLVGFLVGWLVPGLAVVQPLMHARVVDVDLPIQVFSRSHQKLRDGRIVKLFSAEHMRVEYWFGQQRFVKTMHTQSKDWIFL